VLPIVKRLKSELGDRLRFIFRHFPQNTVHPQASVAAQAAEAAAAQGKFWEMHDLLYEHQADLADTDFTHFALTLGLEVYRFQSDLEREVFAQRVAEDFRSGLRSGVNATPSIFINGVRYDGPPEYEPLRLAIDRAMRG
jgi:protein-disulfide isomerase